MCELYLSSSAEPHFPAEELAQLQRHGGPPWTNLQGWGAAWMDGDSHDAPFDLTKHPKPARDAPDYDAILDRAQHSPLWLVHLRAASSGGVSRENTQPYLFAWPETEGPDASEPPTTASGEPHRKAVYMHNGELKGMEERLIETFGHDPRNGTADSEGGMIILRDRLARVDTAEAAWTVFRDWAAAMKDMGIANFIVALGRDVFVQVHRRAEVGQSDLNDPGLYLYQDPNRLRLSSERLHASDEPLSEGALLWIRGTEIVERA